MRTYERWDPLRDPTDCERREPLAAPSSLISRESAGIESWLRGGEAARLPRLGLLPERLELLLLKLLEFCIELDL